MHSDNQNNKSISGITPTIFLRGINISEHIKDYNEGKHRHITLESLVKEKIKVESSAELIYDNNTDEFPYYTFKNRNNRTVIVVSSNSASYYNENTINTKLRCDYCKGRISKHSEDPFKRSIGIPIQVDEMIISTAKGLETINIFVTESNYCRFGCADADVIRLENTDKLLYNSCRGKLGLLFSLYTGKSPLEMTPSNDFRLLRSSGGTMKRKEWLTPENVYVRMHNFIVAPGMVRYMKHGGSNI